MTVSAPPATTPEEHLERALARGTSDLPALPRGAADALALARKTTVDFDEVDRVASSYPPLAARLLAVANSALYVRPGSPRIASVRRGAARMGTQATRDVLYQVAYATMFAGASRFGDIIESTFRRGVSAGRYARLLAVEARRDGDAAFLAGLLHDIGRARGWKILATMRGELDMREAEAAVEAVHASAGAGLAATWHLPDEVVDACQWHHDPQGRPYPAIAAASDGLVHLEETGEGREATRGELLALGLAAEAADRLIAAASGAEAAEAVA